MKKIIYLISIATIASVLTVACTAEVIFDNSDQKSAPELFAYDASTKTVLNNDWSVSWDSSDELTVFNAAAGNDTYSSNCRFLISGTPADGRFIKDASQTDKTLISGANSYDWYVCSPYMPYGANPSGTKGYTIALSPKQVGYNSSAHLTDSDIMAGTAFGVADGQTPSVALHHLATLLKFTVTNNSGEPAAITGLTLDAKAGGTYITGSFTVDWGDAVTSPSLNSSLMGSSKSYTCALSVVRNAGTEEAPSYVPMDEKIANGASVDLYMVVAPFTIPANGEVKLTITGSLGSCSLAKKMTSATTFAAGSYNTANLSYIKPEVTVFTETFGVNTVNTANINSGNYNKSGLTTDVEAHKDLYSYSVTGNASIAVSSQVSAKINIEKYGDFIEGAAIKLPATDATAANSAIYIKNITVDPNTTYIFKYNKSKGTQGSEEYNTNTVFKWRVNGEEEWNTVNKTTSVGTISQEFTTGDGVSMIDIGVEATDRNPAGTITYYPAIDLFKLIKK